MTNLTRNSLLATFIGILAALPACLGTPSAMSRGEFPLELINDVERSVFVEVEVDELHGGSTLLRAATGLEPGERSRVETAEIPHGTYRVEARTDSMSREVDVDFGPTTQYVRLVIHADVIAYETG